MTQRQHPNDRTRELLVVALKLAERTGWRTLTRDAIAEAASVSPGLVSARLGTMDDMRRSVMRLAVRERCLPVLAEGLAVRDRHALKADDALRQAAAAWMVRV